MKSKPPVFAVVCGNVRNLAETLEVFARLIEWRKAGQIKEIIWSTWHGAPESAAELYHLLQKNGVYILESLPTNFSGEGNYLYQQQQLSLALRAVPQDSYVYKCRTDKVLPPPQHQEFLKNLPELTFIETPFTREVAKVTLSEKVVVLGARMFQPFCINDTIYFGKQQDLKKFCNLDCSLRSLLQLYEPPVEALLWGYPFISHIAALYNYATVASFAPWRDLPVARGRVMLERLLELPPFRNYLATGLQVYRHYFYIGFGHHSPEARRFLDQFPCSFLEMFDPSEFDPRFRPLYTSYSNPPPLYDSVWLESFAGGALGKDRGAMLLREALSQMEDPASHTSPLANPIEPPPEYLAILTMLREEFGIQNTPARLSLLAPR